MSPTCVQKDVQHRRESRSQTMIALDGSQSAGASVQPHLANLLEWPAASRPTSRDAAAAHKAHKAGMAHKHKAIP